MASKEGATLTNVKSARVEALARKTELLTENWQRARKAQMQEQLAVNTELKRRWLGLDHREAQQVRVPTSEAASARRSQRRGTQFKALITAAEIRVNNALAYIISTLGSQPLAGHQAHRNYS